MPPIRLAVVDDSAFVRKALRRVFKGNADVEVVGLAASGEELLEHLDDWKPTAVTLDLSMPGMGGMATLDRLMAIRRLPVIILSSHSAADAPLTLEALSHGATDFIDKEEISLVDFESLRTAILDRLRSVAHTPADVDEIVPAPPAEAPPEHAETLAAPAGTGDLLPDIVVIGASTGGPPAIERILGELPAPPAVPIVIVQHMPMGFTTAFAQRLNNKFPFEVREAAHGGAVLPGVVYIAPGGMHTRISFSGNKLTTVLTRYPEMAHRPSVDVLFDSAAALPQRIAAILLTGMGSDGARGLLEIARRGDLTIAQDEATCVVYGMPRCAVDLGAVREQLPIHAIGKRLSTLTNASAVRA